MSGFDHIQRGKTRSFGDWDESKHSRDGGKFAPKEGAPADVDSVVGDTVNDAMAGLPLRMPKVELVDKIPRDPMEFGTDDAIGEGGAEGIRLSRPQLDELMKQEPSEPVDASAYVAKLKEQLDGADDSERAGIEKDIEIHENLSRLTVTGSLGGEQAVRAAVGHEMGHYLMHRGLADPKLASREAGVIPWGDRAKISGYATESEGELFAEISGAVAAGEADKLPDSALMWFDHMMEQVEGGGIDKPKER